MNVISISALGLCIVFLSCSQDTLRITIPSDYCGAVYVVGSKSIGAIPEASVDSNGVGYWNEVNFLKEYRVHVVRDGRDITDSCTMFATGYYFGISDTITYGTFFVPCGDEIGRDESYWRQKEQQQSMTREFVKLVKNGSIRVGQ